MGAMTKLGASLFSLFFVSGSLSAESVARVSQGKDQKTVQLSNFKRGLFVGSCGLSTRSLQWEYTFHLRGPGPRYQAGDIQLKDGSFALIPVSSGTINIDSTLERVTILINVRRDTNDVPFEHNGQYKVKSAGRGG